MENVSYKILRHGYFMGKYSENINSVKESLNKELSVRTIEDLEIVTLPEIHKRNKIREGDLIKFETGNSFLFHLEKWYKINPVDTV